MTDSEKLDLILADMQGMKDDIWSIKQEQLRVNIQRIAEGHLDLYRTFQEATQSGKEVETLEIKVRKLESDVRELKARFA